MQQNKKFNVYKLATIGLMAALVFVSTNIQFMIPALGGGSPTRIHFGNAAALLSGFILGPIGGAFSAAIGFSIYDLTSTYGAAAVVWTFAFRFIMVFVGGAISHFKGAKAEKFILNLVAGIAASVLYMVLHIGRNFITEYFLMPDMENVTVYANLTRRIMASSINAVIAVILSTIVYKAVYEALKSSGILNKVKG